MILYDANRPGPNPVTVRLFALERGGLSFDVEVIDLAGLENRRRPYRDTVNARGEVPALRLDDGQVITEVTAICGYLDEMASGGRRLCGETATERAVVAMWTRRVDLEIVHPFVAWWRGGPEAEDAYRGHRILQPEARRSHRLMADRGLNQLDEDLADRNFLAGNALTLADVLLYGFMGSNVASGEIPWLNVPQRPRVAAWFERMAARPSGEAMMQTLPQKFIS